MAKQKTTVDIEGKLRVKQLLDERGIMMKDFAEQIGITRETLTRALKGNPQYSTLKAIADGLGVTVPELFVADTPKGIDVYGCLVIDGKPVMVNGKEELLNLVKTL